MEKVLVGGSFSCLKRESAVPFLKSLKNLTYKNSEVLLINGTPSGKLAEMPKSFNSIKFEMKNALEINEETLARDRNYLAKMALDNGFDFLLLLEQEVFAQPDIIQVLLAHSKGLCSALYFKPLLTRSKETGDFFLDQQPFAFHIEKETLKPMLFSEIFPSRLLNVEACGLGAMLLSRKALEKVSFKEGGALEFALDCKKNGLEIFLDSSCVCSYISRLR